MAGDDTAPLKLAVLSIAEQSLFVATLAGIFEHSPWIAEQAWDARPFADVEALHRAMLKVMWNAPTQQRLQLIRAHPELTGKEAAAGALTAHSEGEQTSAGLDR